MKRQPGRDTASWQACGESARFVEDRFGNMHGPDQRQEMKGTGFVKVEKRAGIRDFVAGRRFALMEQQQLDDVAWALREKSGGA